MAVARKSTGKTSADRITEVKPADVNAETETLAIAEPVIPGLQETFEATFSKAEEVQEQVRRTAEQSVEQTKQMYEKLKVAAEDATSSVEVSVATVAKGLTEINLKALDAFKATSDAQFAFLKALLATKSLSEAITLQSEHARAQFETMSAQAKDFAALVQQVSADSMEPLKGAFTKSFRIAA